MKDKLHFAVWLLRAGNLSRRSTIIAACLVVALYAFVAYPQSGRHLPKATPRAPEITPEPKPLEKSAPAEKQKIGLILGSNGRDGFMNFPQYFYDVVVQSCADRLRDAPSIKLDVSGRDMNRGEAVRLAKSQKAAFVAMLELKTDGMRGGTNSNNYDELYIEYFLFAPETAKTVASGRAYQGAYRNKGVVIGPRTTGRTSSVYAEQLLKRAARDAADRILEALHVSTQPVPTGELAPH